MANSATLRCGAKMPLVGLGTWKSKPGEVGKAVEHALRSGYRHIDCAEIYGNEPEIGKVFGKVFSDETSNISRSDVFITTKLWNTYHRSEDVEPAIRRSLKSLQLDQLDLYLIHWPTAFRPGGHVFPTDDAGNVMYGDTPLEETWAAMEDLVDKGLTKAIGLSNFNVKQIDRILKGCRIKPSVLQVECHPYLVQKELLEFCRSNGIVMTAYSPLGSPDRPWAKKEDPALMEHPLVKEIADKHGKSPAQVLIRFQMERGVVVIPKSTNPGRISANLDVYGFALSKEELHQLENLPISFRYCIPRIVKDGVSVPRDAEHPEFPFAE